MKITIKDLQKKALLNPKRIKRLVLKVLSSESAKKSGEITICFMNARQIQALNLRFLGKDYPTDVIAFSFDDPAGKVIADIAVSTDAACINAREFKNNLLDEIYLYVIHGLLHILGYDDKNLKQRKFMQAKAENILTEFRKC